MKKFSNLTYIPSIFLLVICSFAFFSTKLPIYAIDSSIFPPPVLEDISINNDSVSLNNDKSINVNGGDAIRLAGTGISGDVVTITFNASEYKTTIQENGKWFVLFSAPIDIKSGKYKVEGQVITKDGQKSEKVLLLTIDLTSLKDVKNTKSNTFADFFHNLFNKNNAYIFIILTLLLIIELTRLVIYIKNTKKITK